MQPVAAMTRSTRDSAITDALPGRRVRDSNEKIIAARIEPRGAAPWRATTLSGRQPGDRRRRNPCPPPSPARSRRSAATRATSLETSVFSTEWGYNPHRHFGGRAAAP